MPAKITNSNIAVAAAVGAVATVATTFAWRRMKNRKAKK